MTMGVHEERKTEGWKTIDELCNAWGKKPFQILEFMRNGLQAYSPSGRKLTDPEAFPKEYNGLRCIEKGLKTETAKRTFWEQRETIKESPFPTKPYEEFSFRLPIDKQKAEIALSKVQTFIFKIQDANEFAQKNGLSLVQGYEADYKIDAESYIKQQMDEGVKKEIIAFRLYDRNGRYKLTYLEIARLMGLDSGLNEGQVAAKKRRAKRMCDKGKDMIAKNQKNEAP